MIRAPTRATRPDTLFPYTTLFRSLSSRKFAALLAILACQPGALHSRARLADLLWSRSAEAQARGSLRQALRQLRKDLDSPAGPVLEADHDRIGLNADGVTVDPAEVEAGLAAGERKSGG